MAQQLAVLFSFAFLVAAGCAANHRRAPRELDKLEAPDTFELVSLNPWPATPPEAESSFHGWQVLGRARVDREAERDELVHRLRSASEEAGGMAVGCFTPRHGIRVVRRGVTTDFVICFRCVQVQVFEGAERTGYFLVSRAPQPVFDDALRSAGLPLAEPN